MIRSFLPETSSPAVQHPAIKLGPGLGRLLALFCSIALFPLAVSAQNPTIVNLEPQASEPTASAVSLAEYQSRLQKLDRIVDLCQQAMTPGNCQSEGVGPDIRLTLPAGTRRIRFAWLRGLLDAAAKSKPAKPAAAPAKAPAAKADSDDDDDAEDADSAQQPGYTPPTLTQQLKDARKRLVADYVAAQQIAQPAAGQNGTQAAQTATRNYTQPRHTLAGILAAKEYQVTVAAPSLWSRVLERVGNWIDHALEKLREAGFHSKWIGLTAEIGFVLVLCIGLVWFLIRLERQGRLGLALIRPGPGSGAASERDWQLWLADARSAAAQGDWRNAIHLLYWASISRLESSGLWPADRARTPREYLMLLAHENSQRPDLVTLTRSFERTWYAGRAAVEADFREAELIAGKLGAR